VDVPGVSESAVGNLALLTVWRTDDTSPRSASLAWLGVLPLSNGNRRGTLAARPATVKVSAVALSALGMLRQRTDGKVPRECPGSFTEYRR